MWTDFIKQHARYQPNSPAIFVEIEDRELSYADLDREISHWAAHFYHRGVRKGYRVALLAQNRLEHITMFFACTRLGAISRPVRSSSRATRCTAPASSRMRIRCRRPSSSWRRPASTMGPWTPTSSSFCSTTSSATPRTSSSSTASSTCVRSWRTRSWGSGWRCPGAARGQGAQVCRGGG